MKKNKHNKERQNRYRNLGYVGDINTSETNIDRLKLCKQKEGTITIRNTSVLLQFQF